VDIGGNSGGTRVERDATQSEILDLLGSSFVWEEMMVESGEWPFYVVGQSPCKFVRQRAICENV